VTPRLRYAILILTAHFRPSAAPERTLSIRPESLVAGRAGRMESGQPGRSVPASIVLPSPASSARMAPFEIGERKANSAASIWCGLRGSCASESTAASFSTL